VCESGKGAGKVVNTGLDATLFFREKEILRPAYFIRPDCPARHPYNFTKIRSPLFNQTKEERLRQGVFLNLLDAR
jgi:hypothetical protein